jgi:hypothetical protein
VIKDIKFHDYKIIGIHFYENIDKLNIVVQNPQQQMTSIEFFEVMAWDFSPFEYQNIIFDLHEYHAKNLPQWMESDFDIPKEYMQSIALGEKKLYYIEPSIGMGGYIIAEKVGLLTT